MDKYDELIKRLRDSEHEIDCSLCDRDCCYKDGKVHGKCIIIEASDAIEELSILADNGEAAYDIMVRQTSHIEELQKKMPRWIPVTERLPEKNGSYLVYVYGEVTEMNCWHGKWHSLGDDYTKAVTHWMPLPSPPVEE